ncbi:MAG TPA: hypothetical protein VND98_05000 [Solirubrobacterales bacterium]|nr:hypothetical protein [Solirubrobacterales bacterium]
MVTVLLAACGSSSSSSTSTNAEVVKAAAAAAKVRHEAEAKAPKGASPTLRAIYATFPAPKPNPEATHSAAAIKAGEKACRGKTPVQVKEEFYAAAKHKLQPEQTKMIDRIGSFENHAPTDASFTSGQLAADVYEAALPPAIGQYGYEGCVYALSQGLEHRLAPKR